MLAQVPVRTVGAVAGEGGGGVVGAAVDADAAVQARVGRAVVRLGLAEAAPVGSRNEGAT